MRIIVKLLLAAGILLSGNSALNAQKRPQKRLTSDIKAGINLTEMRGIPSYSVDNKIGLHLGINVNYKIIGNFQIQSGFIISKKGLKQHLVEITGNEVTNIYDVVDRWYNYTGNYIQVPLNLGYELYFTKNMAFNINGGMYFGYGYKGKTKFHSFATTYEKGEVTMTGVPEPEYEVDTFDPTRWKRFDYGLNGNVGFIYDIYTISFSSEYGLNNVTNVPGLDLKNKLYSLSFGFRF